MKRTLSIALALALTLPAAALAGDGYGHEKKTHQEKASKAMSHGEWYTNEKGVVLDGYDPVSYFQNEKPRQGKTEYSTVYEGATFHFASAENRDMFLENPEKYTPKYGGHCAFAVAAKGKKIPADPTSYEIRDGELLVFFEGEMQGREVDAHRMWMEKGPEKMHTQAQQNWKRMHPKGAMHSEHSKHSKKEDQPSR